MYSIEKMVMVVMVSSMLRSIFSPTRRRIRKVFTPASIVASRFCDASLAGLPDHVEFNSVQQLAFLQWQVAAIQTLTIESLGAIGKRMTIKEISLWMHLFVRSYNQLSLEEAMTRMKRLYEFEVLDEESLVHIGACCSEAIMSWLSAPNQAVSTAFRDAVFSIYED